MRQGTGVICCYSLKNTRFPEYVFNTDAGVCCLEAWLLRSSHGGLFPCLTLHAHTGLASRSSSSFGCGTL